MPLTDNLISYWKLDEASGNALDAHGSNTLTETSGTIDAGTGKINGARDFEAGDSEYFSIADNADLSVGDEDFTITAWINPESNHDGVVVSKYGASGAFSYRIQTVNVGTNIAARVSGNGTSSTLITATDFGTYSTGTWYFVVLWHDAAANQLGISVNDVATTASYSSGIFDSTADFRIGALGNATLFFDGLIDEVGFWKRVLTSGERTQLYNAGSGLAYPFGGGVTVAPHLALLGVGS
jgi:hypothetical protein